MCRPHSCPSCWNRMWLLEKESDLPAVLCATCREGMSRPMCLTEGTLGTVSPCPSVRGANCPSSPQPWAPGAQQGLCVPTRGLLCLRLGLSPCQRGCLYSQGQLGPRQGFRNQMCVMATSCVSLSYFNTRFITCSEINIRRYFLND